MMNWYENPEIHADDYEELLDLEKELAEWLPPELTEEDLIRMAEQYEKERV